MQALSLVVRRYAPFESFGGGYEGDNRGFSTDLQATARTIAVVEFTPGSSQVPTAYGRSSGSAWIGPWGVRKNPRVGPLMGDIALEVGKVKVTLSDVKHGAGSISFTVHSEGNMPMKNIAFGTKGGAQGTPDIDTFIDFTASWSGSRMSCAGVMRGDGFPHAEVLLVDANQRVAPLLDYRTKSWFTGPFYRLFGTGKNNEIARFSRDVPYAGGTFGAGLLQPPIVVQEE